MWFSRGVVTEESGVVRWLREHDDEAINPAVLHFAFLSRQSPVHDSHDRWPDRRVSDEPACCVHASTDNQERSPVEATSPEWTPMTGSPVQYIIG